ncbi:hypothetical protein BGZ95_005122 [Linnemannia exigua]|uniref:Ubiquitin-like protease family profile domain-containing protein n=1 Tax=Linnemannia exigua TaxID=604196 RepID=A0AAD4H9W6_9FUNG|nr:hypothetical protein BGZ95_005122 [Linnemannia exigua]
MDFDQDDADDAVELVRVPAPGMSFPNYSRLLKPSPTTKRTSRGIPIEMPTAQRRETNFSVFIPSTSQTGLRHSSHPKKPAFGQSTPQHVGRHSSQDSTEVKKPAQSAGSLESRKKQKSQEVVLLSDEDDMKDPKTVKRKKHVQEADSRTNGSHATEIRSTSVVSRMRKDTAPVVLAAPKVSPSYMDVDPAPESGRTLAPAPALLAHNTTSLAIQNTVPVSTSTMTRLPSAPPASSLAKLGMPSAKVATTPETPGTTLSKLGSTSEKLTSSSTKLARPSVKPVSVSTTKPSPSITAPSSSTANPMPPSTTPVSPPSKLFSIFSTPTSPISSLSPSSFKKGPTPSSPSLLEKSLQLGVGSFPHLPLDKVRLGTKIEFNRPHMGVQLGPDRLIINIDKNATKIPHETLKSVGYYIGGETQIIILSTSETLDSESILAPHYDPSPSVGKAKRMLLFSASMEPNVEEYCDKLATMGYSTHKLTSESAEKYLASLSGAQSPVEAPSAGTNTVVPRIPGNPDDIQPRQTLFMFPFKSTPKTRSIAVHIEDLSRLYESDFLNDILIEFGLKYACALVVPSQRLIAKPAAHWYLAVITNPWLLLREQQDEHLTSRGDVSVATSTTSTPKGGSRSGSPSDSPVLPTVAESMDRLTGSTEGLLLKSEHGGDKSSTTKAEDDSGRPKRLLRSSAPPIDVNANPYIIVLDSLGGNHPAVFKALRSYLQHELLARKFIKRTLTIHDITGRYAKPPQQQNFSDCGLYLLHYAEVFLRNPRLLLEEIVNRIPEHEKYWMAEELPNKREYYRDVVVRLAEEYKALLASGQQSSSTSLKARADKTGK